MLQRRHLEDISAPVRDKIATVIFCCIYSEELLFTNSFSVKYIFIFIILQGLTFENSNS